MKNLEVSPKFKKDMKVVSKYQNFKKKKFDDCIKKLQNGERLDISTKDHKMAASGVIYQGYRNFHVAPNIAVIYEITDDAIKLYRIGSHSELGLTESVKDK